MSIPYTPTTFNDGIPPAIDAAELNKVQTQLVALSAIVPPVAYPMVGQFIETEIKLTPGANYPVIPRFDSDHDIYTTGGPAGYNAPALVTAYRAQVAEFQAGGSGVTTSFTATSANSGADTTLTFASTAVNQAMVNALANEGAVAGWFNQNQIATFTADYTTSSSQMSINVNGVDYACKDVNSGTRVVTIANVNLGAGSVTVIIYPYRITGSATTCRLRRLAGFIPASAGDYDGALINGLRTMDTSQGHKHGIGSASGLLAALAGGAYSLPAAGAVVSSVVTIASPIADGTNGTPRTSKTTSPRASGAYLYTWAGSLS